MLQSLYTRHALVTSEKFIQLKGNVWIEEKLGDRLDTIRAFADYAYAHDLTHLWIRSDIRFIMPQVASDMRYKYTYVEREKLDGSLSIGTISVTREIEKGRRQVTLIWADNCSWAKEDAWIFKATDKQLLITIAYLEKSLGVPVGGSAANAGWKLLYKLHPEWIDEVPDQNLHECHFGPEAGKDFIWSRRLTDEEKAKGYLYKVDRNAAYPAAAGTSDSWYGVGTPELIKGDCYSDKAIGVWKCSITYGKQDAMLPPIWKLDKGWLAGPHIRLLRSQGHQVKIHEGYVFANRHVLLKQWANRLWQIRVSFENEQEWKHPIARKYARSATKQIAVATVGFTAYGNFADDSLMRRPDIRVQTVARNAELMYHNMVKFRQLGYGTPFLVYMDALYYTGNGNIRAEYPEMLKREKQMGGYSYEGRIPLSQDIIAILEDDKTRAAKKLEILNSYGWEK